jgi:hypothetical protein
MQRVVPTAGDTGRTVATGTEDVKIDPRPDAELRQDEVVMMLMPKATFEAFRKLGDDHGLSPAATMGLALKALQEKANGHSR